MRIEKPGIYPDFPEADYHKDPCPSPSLNQSIAKILVNQSPAHAFIEHPALNPDWEASDPKKYDMGNIAHSLLLGRGRKLHVIQGDDWVKDKKEKAEQRDAALNRGQLGVLSRDYERGVAMIKAAREQLADAKHPTAFGESGKSEVVVAAIVNDLWYRTMIDWITPNYRNIWDYKTTARSAAPETVDYRMVDGGWDVQHAMIEKLLDIVDPDNAGRRVHRCLVQEDYPPYACTVVRFHEDVLSMGRKKLAIGERLWAEAIGKGTWGAYPAAEHKATYPGFAEQKWLEREEGIAGEGLPVRTKLSSMMGG